MPAHCHADKEAQPNGPAHQSCASPSFKEQVAETGDKPCCRPCEPGRAGCGFHLFGLHTFSFYQSTPPIQALTFYLKRNPRATSAKIIFAPAGRYVYRLE